MSSYESLKLSVVELIIEYMNKIDDEKKRIDFLESNIGNDGLGNPNDIFELLYLRGKRDIFADIVGDFNKLFFGGDNELAKVKKEGKVIKANFRK